MPSNGAATWETWVWHSVRWEDGGATKESVGLIHREIIAETAIGVRLPRKDGGQRFEELLRTERMKRQQENNLKKSSQEVKVKPEWK